MGGHRSHQSGRDVDIAYYQTECAGPCRLQPVDSLVLDATRQWRLLRHWLVHNQVEYIFIDYALQAALYAEAVATGASKSQLARWFQYPRGPAHSGGTIRHIRGHDDHLHVRFRCAADDDECQATRWRARETQRDAGQEHEGDWLELLGSEGDERTGVSLANQ